MIRFFRELFIVDGSTEGSLAALVPYILTAVALGVLLSGVYYVLWRLLERRILSPLVEHPEGITLWEAGLDPKRGFVGRITALLLRSSSCFLYKTLTHEAYENRGSALMDSQTEEGDPTAEDAADARGKAVGKKKKKKPTYALPIFPDTYLTLRQSRVEYARRQVGQTKGDILMPLLYTSLITLAVWMCLMGSLDSIMAMFLEG